MNAKNHYASDMYTQVSLESRVLNASPHQLIMLLFEGAHSAILRAKLFIQQGNIPQRGIAISKAISIINDGLLGALDYEKGGDIAQQLAQLYDYMIRTLLKANRYADIEALSQVDEILMQIADGWKQIGNR